MTTKPDVDPIVALRETAECLLLTQREMGSDVADMAQAVTELTQAAEGIANALSTVEELKRAVEQTNELLMEYPRKLAELFDSHRELQAQVGRYISDQSKQESGIRTVEPRLKALELRLGLRASEG